MAYAWNQGIHAAASASPTDIANHDYVKKFKNYAPKIHKSEIDPLLELIGEDSELSKSHWKIFYLEGETLENYLEDNLELLKLVRK